MSKYKVGDKVYFLDEDEGIVTEIGSSVESVLPDNVVWCKWKSTGRVAWFHPEDTDFSLKKEDLRQFLTFESGDLIEEEESGERGVVIGSVPPNSLNGKVIIGSYNDKPEDYYFIEWESGDIAFLHKLAFKRIVH